MVGSGCSISPKPISSRSCLSLTGTTPAAVSRRTSAPSPRAKADPSTGCPANGSSTHGVKIRMRASACEASDAGSTKTVSERFSSRAARCISSGSSPDPSRNTATGLPYSGSSVNTSTTTYRCTARSALPGHVEQRRHRRPVASGGGDPQAGSGQLRPQLRSRDPFGVPGVQLAPDRDQPLGLGSARLELAQHVAVQLVGGEGDLVALRIVRHVRQRIARYHLLKLCPGADDDRDVKAKVVGDPLLALPLDNVQRKIAGKNDVATLHIGTHVLETLGREQLAQLRHRDSPVRAEVDTA